MSESTPPASRSLAAAPPEKLTGLQGELHALSLDAACTYYHNYLNAFQLDIPLAISFVNRMLSENVSKLAPWPRALLEQALAAAVQLAAFDTDILNLGLHFGICPNADTRVKILKATHVEPQTLDRIRKTPLKRHSGEIRQLCEDVLARHPMAMVYADCLLQVDLFEGKRPSEALRAVHCPRALRPLWNERLFNHHAALGDDAQSWPLWEVIKEQANDPFTLSRAAEMYRRQGGVEQALALYGRALELAPLQRPYAERIKSLRAPFQPDPGLVETKRVSIYLYSYNKARMLGETLESLSRCDIGPARVTVLVNGCTDDSAAVVARARELFARNALECIELPVNIGAPAARNWLLALPSTRESEYVAFLDDDVILQPDWLAHMLTVAESDARIGNVGCKVVFPGEFRQLQYLYRHVSLASEDLIRISLPTPYMQYDIGLYDVIREGRVVMGCQHLLRVASLEDVPWFDIRYSPTQLDDTDHDIGLCLAGWKVFYCGTVTCLHRQNSGTSAHSNLDMASLGGILGNDLKFSYKWYGQQDALRALDSLTLNR